MKKMKLKLDKSLLKKARKEGLQNGVAVENADEQQNLMGQVAEPKKKKLNFKKPNLQKLFKFKIKKEKELQPGKFSRLQSMQTKVMILVAVAVIVSVFALYQVMMSSMKDLLIDSAIGKMLNVVTSYGKVIDKEESELNANSLKVVYLEPEQYGELLEGMEVEGVKNFQYMMLHRSGVIKYHPDESKWNMPTGIQELNDLIAGLNVGQIPENMYTKYQDKDTGEMMYASFYITGIRSVALVCASEAELLAPIASLRTLSLLLGVVILAVAVVIAGFVVTRITKPLNQVTDVINDTAKLKLSLPEYMDKLCARKDEAGMISRAVKEMSEYLHDVVIKIDEANANILSLIHI